MIGLWVFSLLASACGEYIGPGVFKKYEMKGYPAVDRGASGTDVFEFEVAPGSQIITYCTDFRPLPRDPSKPCETFQMTVSDGETEKKFCKHRDEIDFMSKGSSLRVEFKYIEGTLISCVARSTEDPKGTEIVVDTTKYADVLEDPDNDRSFFDKLWVVKSADGGELTLRCTLNMQGEYPCIRERFSVDNGTEKTIKCERSDFQTVSSAGEIKVRATLNHWGLARFRCSVVPKEVPPQFSPDAPKGKETIKKSFHLAPGEVIEDFGNEDNMEAGRHIFDFNTVQGSTVHIFCRSFYDRDAEDSCDNIEVNFFDGVENNMICGNQERPIFVSKTSRAILDIKYNRIWIMCTARTSASPSTQEIPLEVSDGVYKLEHNAEKTTWYDKKWTFVSPVGTGISIQCQISSSSDVNGTICTTDLLHILHGETKRTECGYKKVVEISKDRSLTLHVQYAPGHSWYDCKVQVVTGPSPNQMDNMALEDSAETAGTGGGRKATSCPCGSRNHEGRKVSRIFFGNDTKEGEYPWMVGIRDHGNWQRCGASLITAYHVLTAAHCMTNSAVRNRTDIMDTVIYVGAYSVYQNASHGKTRGYEVKQTFIPDEWWQFKRGYDIAVLVLKEKVAFSRYVQPVCLAQLAPKIVHTTLKAIGWGQTENGKPEYLLATKLFVSSNADCGVSHILCTNNRNSSVCYGDSGGPLIHLDPETNRYTQVGVASAVNYPYCYSSSIYTNVTFFYDYIQTIINETTPTEICVKTN